MCPYLRHANKTIPAAAPAPVAQALLFTLRPEGPVRLYSHPARSRYSPYQSHRCNHTTQPSCSALFTSIIIAEAVGSVNPPAKVEAPPAPPHRPKLAHRPIHPRHQVLLPAIHNRIGDDDHVTGCSQHVVANDYPMNRILRNRVAIPSPCTNRITILSSARLLVSTHTQNHHGQRSHSPSASATRYSNGRGLIGAIA